MTKHRPSPAVNAALSRRGFLVGIGGISAAAALAACGTGTGASSSSADSSPVPGGTLKIAFWNDLEGSIDPNQVYWIETRSLNRNMADSLTDQDPQTGEIVPWLAKSWTVSPDASEYTFVLREDVTFSDGTKFNAAAVKTAYDGIVALGANSTLGIVYLQGCKSTTVIDDYTVKVWFNGPNAQFLQASSTTTLAILSPATYGKTPAQRSAGAVIGSGPFILDSYTAAQSVKLTKRKDYAWPSGLVKNQGAAYLDEIDVSYILEDNVRVGSLIAGDIDIAWPRQPISSADQQRIQQSGATIVQRSLPGISGVLVPNVRHGGPLADLTVRQALYKALDVESYATTIYWDSYPVVTSPLDSSTPSWTSEASLLAHDPAGAGTLLDQAGWTLGSDGYRHKGGQKLSLVYLTAAPTPGDQLVQSQLKQVGIDYQIKTVTTAQLISDENAGAYDLTQDYLTRADPSVLGAILDTSVSKASLGVNSQDDVTAAQVSKYFEQGLSTVDKPTRDSIYAELQKYLIDQGVAFPLYERVQVNGVSNKVHGFAWTSESFLRTNDIWKSS